MKSIQGLFILLSFLILTACQPQLKEFQPANDSLFKITFSYPADWNWEEDIPFDEPPLNVELPPSERIILANGDLQSGSITIQVYYASPASLVNIKDEIDSYSGDFAFTVLSNIAFQIDGNDARWFTLSGIAYSAQGKIATQNEVIYLFSEDRYYEITLFVLETKKDERFHKQFEGLIKSIKVLQ